MDLYWFDLALNIDLFSNVQVFEKQRVPTWQLININYKKRSKSCNKQLWIRKLPISGNYTWRRDLLAAKQTWWKLFKSRYVFYFRTERKYTNESNM